MLGFNPLSSAPISDLGALAPITGYISTTDTNDTALLTGAEIDTGVISTTDGTDTASISGNVIAGQITGTISATDNNDTANFQGANSVAPDTHDGFTKEEIRRAKRLDKKIRDAEQKRIEANKAQALSRKNTIKELVDPTPKVKKSKVESNQQVSEDIPLEVTNYDAVIANLERQRQELFHAVALRMEISRIQTELAIMKAKQEAELDDEQALLLLL